MDQGMIPSIKFLRDPYRAEVLDQRKLPREESVLTLQSVQDVHRAIENMTVRGAPVS